MVITPSSYDYDIMELEDVVVIDLEGNLIEGIHKPSSEWKMHAEIYKHLPDTGAVVHTHSPVSYTHLDVYKRQPRRFSTRFPSLP